VREAMNSVLVGGGGMVCMHACMHEEIVWKGEDKMGGTTIPIFVLFDREEEHEFRITIERVHTYNEYCALLSECANVF
jgi:hypothetical protein